MLKVNEKAPDFTLADQLGNLHSLVNYKGSWLLIYFYPKDFTSGCTKEACSLRDNFSKLKDKIQIVGISGDSVESHKKFAEKYSLPFTLLADTDRNVITAFKKTPRFHRGDELNAIVSSSFRGNPALQSGEDVIKDYGANGLIFAKRTSFLVNPQGVIEKIYERVNPATHAEEILNDLDTVK